MLTTVIGAGLALPLWMTREPVMTISDKAAGAAAPSAPAAVLVWAMAADAMAAALTPKSS